MKSISGIFFILLAACFSATAQKKQQVPLNGTDSVRTLIEQLPEVKEKNNVYDSISNRVQHIIIKITPPDSVIKTYHAEAGYQGNNRFQPHFYFTVDLQNNIIYIEDTEQGDRTTLDEWRARRSAAKGQK